MTAPHTHFMPCFAFPTPPLQQTEQAKPEALRPSPTLGCFENAVRCRSKTVFWGRSTWQLVVPGGAAAGEEARGEGSLDKVQEESAMHVCGRFKVCRCFLLARGPVPADAARVVLGVLSRPRIQALRFVLWRRGPEAPPLTLAAPDFCATWQHKVKWRRLPLGLTYVTCLCPVARMWRVDAAQRLQLVLLLDDACAACGMPPLALEVIARISREVFGREP